MYGYQRPRGLDCAVEEASPPAPDYWVQKRKALRDARGGINRRCAIYRHYDDCNRLLYVGKSVQPLNRQQQHMLEARWFHQVVRIEIQWFDLTTDMDEAEICAIEREKPLFNLIKW